MTSLHVICGLLPPNQKFWLRLCSNLNISFLVLHLFSYFFFLFLLRLSTFEPLNALYLKFERLKISGDFCATEIGGANMGPQSERRKFEFLTVTARWIKFSEWVDIKNKLNPTKIRVPQRRFSPQTGLPKFKLFNLLY